MRITTVEALLRENGELVNENIALKKQVNEVKIQSVAKEVADHVDNWLSRPYGEGETERQDIDGFALQITRYIDHRLRD